MIFRIRIFFLASFLRDLSLLYHFQDFLRLHPHVDFTRITHGLEKSSKIEGLLSVLVISEVINIQFSFHIDGGQTLGLNLVKRILLLMDDMRWKKFVERCSACTLTVS